MKVYTYKGRKFVGLESHPVTDEQDLVCREVIGRREYSNGDCEPYLGGTAIISRKELVPTQEEFR